MPRRAQITTIRQNYVDDDDLYKFLGDTFAAGTYVVIVSTCQSTEAFRRAHQLTEHQNLNDGGRRVEAPRKLTTVSFISALQLSFS